MKNSEYVLLKKIYDQVDPFAISFGYREKHGLRSKEFTYGEATFPTLEKLVSQLALTDKDVFYDLGSGSGKVVLAVALLSKARAVGIEIIPEFVDFSNRVKRMLGVKNAEFRKADFLRADFGDATVVFLQATCFTKKHWARLCAKLNRLKPGTRVVLVTKPLESRCFVKLSERKRPFSWGDGTVGIYRRVYL